MSRAQALKIVKCNGRYRERRTLGLEVDERFDILMQLANDLHRQLGF